VFVAEVTDEFNLGLDVMRAYEASVDLGHHLLRLGQEVVTLWRPDARPKSARPSLAGDEEIPSRFERVLMARVGAPARATKVLIEHIQNYSSDRVFIARTLVRARPRVPARIMNMTNQDQVLSEGTTIRHGETAVGPQTLRIRSLSHDRTSRFSKQLKEGIAGARPNLSIREAQALEELIADYQDVIETKGIEHGRTEEVHYRIDTGDARHNRQPSRRLPLEKQAEVNVLLEDMKSKGVIEEPDRP